VLGDQLGDDDVRLIRPSLDAHGPEPGWPPSTSALRPDLIRQRSVVQVHLGPPLDHLARGILAATPSNQRVAPWRGTAYGVLAAAMCSSGSCLTIGFRLLLDCFKTRFRFLGVCN
jgi:hypothetical protein